MKALESTNDLLHSGEEALRQLLSQVSTIKFREIHHKSPASRTKAQFVAYVEVLGSTHELACEVRAFALIADLKKSLEELVEEAALISPETIPVLIAPYISPMVQAICKEHRAAFVDFAGNARISLGEVFIVKRSMRMSADTLSASASSNVVAGQKPRLSLPVFYSASDIPVTTRRHVDTAAIIGAA